MTNSLFIPIERIEILVKKLKIASSVADHSDTTSKIASKLPLCAILTDLNISEYILRSIYYILEKLDRLYFTQ